MKSTEATCALVSGSQNTGSEHQTVFKVCRTSPLSRCTCAGRSQQGGGRPCGGAAIRFGAVPLRVQRQPKPQLQVHILRCSRMAFRSSWTQHTTYCMPRCAAGSCMSSELIMTSALRAAVNLISQKPCRSPEAKHFLFAPSPPSRGLLQEDCQEGKLTAHITLQPMRQETMGTAGLASSSWRSMEALGLTGRRRRLW